MLGLIAIIQARLRVAGEGEDAFLYPEIRLVENFFGPGWTSSPSPTAEGAIKYGLSIARKHNVGRGEIYIEDSDHPAYRTNGPRGFSAEAHARHGLKLKEGE